MQVLTILELCFIALVTLYIFHEYSAKNIPFWIKFICYIGWLLSFVMIILVPLDVYFTLRKGYVPTSVDDDDDPDSTMTPEDSVKAMIISWRVVYWSNFAFTWFILPTLQQYLSAGDFSPKEKFIRAIKANLRTYAIMIVCGIIFLLYLRASNRVGREGVGNFLITFSNCFGLIIIIICLSYGLVALPKKCLQQSKQDLNLKLHQYEVGLVGEQRQDVILDLEELIKSIDSLLRRKDVSQEDKDVLKKILVDVPQSLLEDVKENIIESSVPPVGSYAKLTRSELDSINKKMYTKLSELRRLNTKWDVKVRNSFFLEDITESNSPAEWRTKQSYSPSKFRILDKLCSPFEWFYYKYVSGIVFFIVGLILIGASIIVFLAEILNFYEVQVVNVENMFKSGGHLFIKSQLFCLLPLFYISSCIYSALFNMKFTGRYGLYSHHLTDAPSLIFSSLNFSRVSSPMVFNFLSMIKLKNTAFQTVMGNGLFFKSFMRYFPLLLALLIVCNIFDVFGRFLGYFGLNRFRFNEESTNEKIEYGQKLLSKARSVRARGGGVSTRGTRRNVSEDPLNHEDNIQKDVISRGYLLNDKKSKPNARSLNDI